MKDFIVDDATELYLKSGGSGVELGILENESLAGVALEDLAVMVPEQLFDARKNEPAFIFSSENLREIKRYVARVHRLPVDKGRLAATADFSALGLNLDEVHDFYEGLRAHARSWAEIEVSTKRLGNELQVFSETLLNTGGEFIVELKSTNAWAGLDVKLADVDSMDPLRVRALTEVDCSILKEGVDTYLVSIREDIEIKLSSISLLMALAESFAEVIASSLKPTADSFVEAINEQNISENLVGLEDQLTLLDKEIQERTEEYKGLVGSACRGLIFGPIGVTVSGSIYGPRAETVRCRKNELIARRLELLQGKSRLEPQQQGFEDTKTVMLELQFRLVEVHTAVKHLHDVWLLLHTYVNESMERLEFIDTNARLKKFVFQFERVIRPWEKIMGISKDVSILFNEALRENFQSL